MFPVRYLVFFGAAIGSSMIGSLNSGMNFAWVCMVNTSNGSSESASRYPKLDWGNNEQQLIFSGLGIGGLLMAIPSGWIINHFGSRTTLSSSLTICGVASLLVPVTSQRTYVGVAVLSMIIGTSTCILFPITFNVCSWWAPKAELGKAMALAICGVQIGRLVQTLIAGVECRYIGWEWIFYISGITSIIFSALWFLIYRDDPEDFKFITEGEVRYIADNRQRKRWERSGAKIPVVALLSNLGVWSCVVCRFCVMALDRGLNRFIPTYNQQILHLSDEMNGYMTAVAVVAQFLARIVTGYLSDLKVFNETIRMKIINTVSFVGSAAFSLGLAFVHETSPKALPIFLYSAVMYSITMTAGGYTKAPVYMAPQFSAFIGSIQELAGNVAALSFPFIVDNLVEHHTLEEWAVVFYIIAAVCALGAGIFLIFGTGRLLFPPNAPVQNGGPDPAIGSTAYTAQNGSADLLANENQKQLSLTEQNGSGLKSIRF